RLGDGNTSNVKPIGEGAAELRVDRGPGYRIYFGWDGKVLVILLGGGTKRRFGGGATTSDASPVAGRIDDATDQRFSANNPGARYARCRLSQGAVPASRAGAAARRHRRRPLCHARLHQRDDWI